MSQTYTHASDRGVRRTTRQTPRLYIGYLLLALTTLVAMLGLRLAYLGRMAALNTGTSINTPINLNTVSAAHELEPLFDRLRANASDRQLAANTLFEFILSERNAGQTLPNVGAIARAKTPASSIGLSQTTFRPWRRRCSAWPKSRS